MAGLKETIAALKRRQHQVAHSPGFRRMRAHADFGANPGAVRALFYSPTRSSGNVPLVVALHGCTQNAEDYAENAGWLQLAEAHGFAVLAPEQTRANNANLCFNWFLPGDTKRGEGEAASIAQMVTHLIATEAIDPKRVFITGLSAGGAMSAVMLATYPELFAAGAVIAGLPFGAASSMPSAFAAMAHVPERTAPEWGEFVRQATDHSGPWPSISIWHGDADATVRAGAADALARQWTDVHGLEDAAPQRSENAQRLRSVWTSANGRALVTYHQLRGMGHGAPVCASGPQSCGVAAPFMLDIGVSSSFESVVAWGIVQAPARAATPIARVTTPPNQSVSLKARGRALDVNAVITTALRSAGLMK